MNYKGLTTEEALKSRKDHGSNIRTSLSSGGAGILLEVLKEPMVLLLIVACVVYFVMGELQEGIIMASAIMLVSGISVYQQMRSESALKALGKLTQKLSTVVRDGKQVKLPSEELVLGDLVIYSEGEQISADASIIEFNDLSVDESILTGESLAIQDKKADDRLMAGTTVNSGIVWAKVIAIGNATRIGKMGRVMEETMKEKTPLQRQVSRFVKRMAFFGVIAFLFVWLYNYLDSGDVMSSLMHGLTLAMAVLPEEIPVALATFMALGAYRMIKNNVLARHPQTVEALGAATVICVDKTGTITENKMNVSAIYDHRNSEMVEGNVLTPESKELLLISLLASEEDPFDPMEKAIHLKYNAEITDQKSYEKIHEYPIGGTHPMMTHIYRDQKGVRIIAAKGAPEGIIALSGLTENEKEVIHLRLTELAQQGNRVLGIGRGVDVDGELPPTQQEFQFEFLGLLALSDPPRKDIPEVIQSFYDSGIEVKMITGDYPETAKSIAGQVGIHNKGEVLTGKEIAAMSDDVLTEKLRTVNVLARVSSEIKLKVINVLKAMGEVVAMTGDGVNDGPALKAAHIGVAMGKRGSEVARQASSLVLINDNLGGMVKAVEFGRSIYANLKRAIRYIISIHIPLISMVALPILLGWKFPHLFSPVHVIFLELIMGPTCSIVYENEPMDPRLMKQKPRKMTDSLFTRIELSRSVIQGLMIAVALLALTYYLIESGSSEVHTRTMVFTALVFSNILLTLTGRSETDSIFKTIRYKNNLVPVVIGVTLSIMALALYFKPVMNIFEFETISPTDLLICFAVAMAGVMWIEVRKVLLGKFNSSKN